MALVVKEDATYETIRPYEKISNEQIPNIKIPNKNVPMKKYLKNRVWA